MSHTALESRPAYDDLILDLCAAVGTGPWNAVAASQGLQLNGRDVEIGYVPEVDPDTLLLSVKLGHVETPHLPYHLLVQNHYSLGHLPGDGFFAVHPVSGEVLYKRNVRLDHELTGRRLAEELVALVTVAESRFERSF